MLLNIKHQANWKFIKENKEKLIQQNNTNENKTRIEHTYQIGDEILLKADVKSKLGAPYIGPYIITQTYTNGTVKILRGSVIQRVNIRRIRPYFSQHDHHRKIFTAQFGEHSAVEYQ